MRKKEIGRMGDTDVKVVNPKYRLGSEKGKEAYPISQGTLNRYGARELS